MKRATLLLLLLIGTLSASVHCSGEPALCIASDGTKYPCDEGVQCEGDTTSFGCGDTWCDSATQFCYDAIGIGGMRFPATCTYYPKACTGGCGCDCITEKGSTQETCTGTVATGITVTHNNIAQ